METRQSPWGQIAYSLKVSKKKMNKTITKASRKLATYNFKQAGEKERAALVSDVHPADLL